MDFLICFKSYKPNPFSFSNEEVLYNVISSNILQGYTISSSVPSTLAFSFMNYYLDSANTVNDLSHVPSILRITGTINYTFKSLSLFLNNGFELSSLKYADNSSNFSFGKNF